MESDEDTERGSEETPIVYSPPAVVGRMAIDARLDVSSFGIC
jgi:hypothetical protein